MRWLRVPATFLVASAACAPPLPPPKKATEIPLTEPAIDTDRHVDLVKAKRLLDLAMAALGNKDVEGVKRLCGQADRYADETIREELRKLIQRTDEFVARGLAPTVLKLAETGKCKEAAEEVIKISEVHSGTAVIHFVREEVSKPLLGCLYHALAVDISVARELAEVPEFKKVLLPDDFQQWDSKLDDTIVGSLVASLQVPISRRQWAKAVSQLDELVERKEAGPREVARVMKVVRAGIAEDVEKKVAAGLGNRIGAAKLAPDVAALLALGRWTDEDPMPDSLAARRDEAAFWTTCASQFCNLDPPEEAWSFGTLEASPVLDVTGPPVATIKHGRKLWRIASGLRFVLVADHDPGPLDGYLPRLRAGLGWVPLNGLSTADTAEVLPPGNAIVGTRVWGGLRATAKEWELGIVRDVVGPNLTVERIADGRLVNVLRSNVKFGTIRRGTKVLALCSHPIRMELAEIDEFITMSSGDPHLKLTCLDANGIRTPLVREVLIGSLRAAPALLPDSP